MPNLINIPVANLYLQPDNHSEVVSQALYGWEVTPLSTHGDYIKVQMADGYQGWIEKNALLETHNPNHAKRAKIIHRAAHVYHVPDTTKKKPLMTLPFEVALNIIAEPEEEQHRWLQIQLVDGSLGWIQKGDIQINPSLLSMNSMITLSHCFIGLPYTWGGVSSFGYDCSGYVQMLYRQKGVILPRDARDQAKSPLGYSIKLEEAKSGDLIFFGPSSEKIVHVGLCLDNQQMIHATVKPTPVLQVTSLQDAGLRERFQYRIARRINSSSR